MACSIILLEMQIPAEAEGVTAASLYEALKGVKDKRSRRGKRYPAAVLTLLVLAQLAGQVKRKGIAEWVEWQDGKTTLLYSYSTFAKPCTRPSQMGQNGTNSI